MLLAPSGSRESFDASKEPMRRNWIGRLSYPTPWAPRNEAAGFSKPPITPSKAMLRGALGVALVIFIGTAIGVLSIDGPDPWGLKSTLESKLETYGTPYDTSCTAPDMMTRLRIHIDNEARAVAADQPPRPLRLPLPKQRPAYRHELSLPWLFGKTVVLIGDHVERLHNKDFCRFVGGKFISAGPEHAISPPPFHNGIDEKLGSANQTNFVPSRPTVCYVEHYDFMMISVFHYGFINRVEAERENLLWDPHFYAPGNVQDRISYLIKKLLRNLDRQVNFIEFSSSVWDLRHFSVLDELAKKSHLDPLSASRLAWYSQRLKDTFEYLAESFPGTPLSWRTLQQTPLFDATPFGRVAELDRVSRKVIEDLNRQWAGHITSDWIHEWENGPDSSAHSPPTSDPNLAKRQAISQPSVAKKLSLTRARESKVFNSFLLRINERIKGDSVTKTSETDMSDFIGGPDPSKGKLRIAINEWGALMLGQPTADNQLYTPALPGGYLWGDMLLFLQVLALEKEFGNH
ncbi:BZ3500_MvSof-1268-A1-R1_Chr2-1g04260 [Microbotryum saponariae]|uniref:BZ3500_MvSof-1268-A1-R1_Chr2-1g04260 protein n=1 Tax=Microbotryum saponariae TaxID=289078 RepID=A0A2X0KY20_9BASI|nr:BZ3500_MvSof-1268-A1-R1_Chr2-1g04260 [Microbotryum saponariae]SCZ91251.1 BZ3501_MvSof-1269-A2-R1_Chr2-1g03916 [Microbotryum saponariae]